MLSFKALLENEDHLNMAHEILSHHFGVGNKYDQYVHNHYHNGVLFHSRVEGRADPHAPDVHAHLKQAGWRNDFPTRELTDDGVTNRHTYYHPEVSTHVIDMTHHADVGGEDWDGAYDDDNDFVPALRLASSEYNAGIKKKK